jgi:hypothetical protein
MNDIRAAYRIGIERSVPAIMKTTAECTPSDAILATKV